MDYFMLKMSAVGKSVSLSLARTRTSRPHNRAMGGMWLLLPAIAYVSRLSFYLSPGTFVSISERRGHSCIPKTIRLFHLTSFIQSKWMEVGPSCQSWLGECRDTGDVWHGIDDTNAHTPRRTSNQTEAKGIFKIYSWNVQSYFGEGSHNITSARW